MILAFFDVLQEDQEPIEVCGANVLPTVGGTVTFGDGEHQGRWYICGVKQEEGLFDGLVFLDAWKGK